MRKTWLSFVVLLAGAAVFAQTGPMPGHRGAPDGFFAGDPLSLDLGIVAAELGDRKLGDLDGPALAALGQKLRMAALERAYVRHVAAMSFMMPGAGQFAAGDGGTGAAFLASHIAICAGSIVGAYFLLPTDLHLDRLDYLGSPISSLDSAWNAHSVIDYLPAAGILAAGMIVDLPIRFFASRNAADDARAALKTGKIDLETQFGPGFAGWRLRY